jgi:hypothetical protein
MNDGIVATWRPGADGGEVLVRPGEARPIASITPDPVWTGLFRVLYPRALIGAFAIDEAKARAAKLCSPRVLVAQRSAP